MAANQADPSFEMGREQTESEAARKATKKHRKDLAAAGILIPGVAEESDKEV